VRKSNSARSRNHSSSAIFFSIILLAGAFASTVVAGAFLSARFVTRSIERVTRLALAIDPRAPQASISLDEIPIELKPLASALNRAFHEIDAYIQRQRRFLGNAAHQLRTPLTLLRAKIEDVTEPALKAELVCDVRRLTSLVSAMLDLARLQDHAIEKRAHRSRSSNAGRPCGFQPVGAGCRGRALLEAGSARQCRGAWSRSCGSERLGKLGG